MGFAADNAGFGLLVHLQMWTLVSFACTCWIPSWTAAWFANVFLGAYVTAAWLMSAAWFVYFATPDVLGMVYGTWLLFQSIFSMCIQTAITAWSAKSSAGLSRFAVPLHTLNAITILASLYFYMFFLRCPPFPAVPRKIDQARAQVGVGAAAAQVAGAIEMQDILCHGFEGEIVESM